MFTRNTNLSSSNSKLDNYVSGNDVYNSSLMLYLSDPDILRVKFTITTQQYRPDLIAEDFYNDSSYACYVVLLAAIPLYEMKLGVVLELIPLKILNSIINGI